MMKGPGSWVTPLTVLHAQYMCTVKNSSCYDHPGGNNPALPAVYMVLVTHRHTGTDLVQLCHPHQLPLACTASKVPPQRGCVNGFSPSAPAVPVVAGVGPPEAWETAASGWAAVTCSWRILAIRPLTTAFASDIVAADSVEELVPCSGGCGSLAGPDLHFPSTDRLQYRHGEISVWRFPQHFRSISVCCRNVLTQFTQLYMTAVRQLWRCLQWYQITCWRALQ